jgi:hypothetical protein
MEEAVATDACDVVALVDAVARVSTTAVSFVGWVHAGVGTLQRSRQSVHLRSEAPIAGIAWSHCLVETGLLQSELPSVAFTHGQPGADRELGRKARTGNTCSCAGRHVAVHRTDILTGLSLDEATMTDAKTSYAIVPSITRRLPQWTRRRIAFCPDWLSCGMPPILHFRRLCD